MSTTNTTTALSVACPTCFAAAGEPCRSRPKNHVEGAELPTCAPHGARKTAAKEAGKMPICPRNHREEAAKARCRAYWERTGHLNPRHLPKTKEA